MKALHAAAWMMVVFAAGALAGCSGGDEPAPPSAAGPRVLTDAEIANIPDAPPPRQKQPDVAEEDPEGFRTTDDTRTRYERTRPDALHGVGQVAAPLRYVRTTVRARQAASDKLRLSIANRALRMFRVLHDDRMPKDFKELNDWYIEQGNPEGIPMPDNRGVYALHERTKEFVIVDGK